VSSNKTVNINVPVLARVEGEGALDLRIEDDAISELKLRIFEPPRYFEKFLEGRSHQDVIDSVARICGICPVAYQMSAVQALESIYQTTVSPWVHDMRQVMYCGEWLQSHSLHVHMLAAPDFLGANSIIEMAKDHDEAVRRGLRLQSLGNDLIGLLGARSVHPVGVCVGGFFHAPKLSTVAAMVDRLALAKADAAEVVRWIATLDLPSDEQDFTSVSLRHPEAYPMIGGRMVSDGGLDIDISEFDQHFTEQHIPHSTALHCLLQEQPYLVGPLARLNLNIDRLPEETRELLDETGIRFPSRNMFHSIVARAVEMHYAVCLAHDLLQVYAVPDTSKVEATPRAGIGFGCTEAPRGILWHRYETDEEGLMKSVRIVPPTSQNQARMEQDIAQSLMTVGLDQEDDSLRLHAEKVIRNYDPCISCATHFLKLTVHHGEEHIQTKGQMPAGEREASHDEAQSVLVVGVGSPHGSDALGWKVVNQLKQDDVLSHQAGLRFLCLDRPGTRLLEAMRDEERVILVDAISGSGKKGALVRMEGREILAQDDRLSSHDLGLASTIQIGGSLDRLPPHLILLGLETHGDIHWQCVHDELDRLLESVKKEIITALSS
jgi:sulfhydrogenase subunit alpha